MGMTHASIQKLLDIADERMRVVILLCSGCGLRIGSIGGLNVGSCEEYKGRIRLPFMRTNQKSILYSLLPN